MTKMLSDHVRTLEERYADRNARLTDAINAINDVLVILQQKPDAVQAATIAERQLFELLQRIRE